MYNIEIRHILFPHLCINSFDMMLSSRFKSRRKYHFGINWNPSDPNNILIKDKWKEEHRVFRSSKCLPLAPWLTLTSWLFNSFFFCKWKSTKIKMVAFWECDVCAEQRQAMFSLSSLLDSLEMIMMMMMTIELQLWHEDVLIWATVSLRVVVRHARRDFERQPH